MSYNKYPKEIEAAEVTAILVLIKKFIAMKSSIFLLIESRK